MKKVPRINGSSQFGVLLPYLSDFHLRFSSLLFTLSPLSVSATLTSVISLEVNPPLSSFPPSLPSSLNPLVSLSASLPPSIRVYQSPSFFAASFVSVALPRPGRVVMVTRAAWHYTWFFINGRTWPRPAGRDSAAPSWRCGEEREGSNKVRNGGGERDIRRLCEVNRWSCGVNIVNIPLTESKCVSSCDS